MNYFYSITDSKGFVHSIDNCILQYDLYTNGLLVEFLAFLHYIRDKYNLDSEYWERLNCSACSHYQWFYNHIHLCNGIYLSIGKYNNLNSKLDKNIIPVIKLEINLNKHSEKPQFKELNKWLIKNSGDITLLKYDYAVDVPVTPDLVEVFGSNKERGLYKGTRYFGQRNKNGYCKIYDKQKEQGLENPLTRIEHTISHENKKYKNLSLENLYIKSEKQENVVMNDTDRCIISMLNSLKVHGEDITRYTEMLGRGKKEKILTLLNCSTYEKIEFNETTVKLLLNKIKDLTNYTDKAVKLYEDVNGFLKVGDDNPLPFD